MRLVGLTGGIASGKSTVSNYFKANGVPVVDADVVARNTLNVGTRGYKKVVEAFGPIILQTSGDVDRLKLGEIVFSDSGKRQVLNRLLAPHIKWGIIREVLKLWLKGYKVIVLDIPLLFEAKMEVLAKPIIVVWVDRTTQMHRLMQRNNFDENEATIRINSQMSLDAKRDKADIVIDNSGSLEDLDIRLKEVYSEVSKKLAFIEFMRSRGGVCMLFLVTVAGVGGRLVYSKL